MSLLFVESFDWINTSITGPNLDDVLGKRYDEVNVTTSTDAQIVVGRRSGGALQFRSSTNAQLIRTPVLRDATIDQGFVCGFALKTPTSLFFANSSFFSIMVGGAAQLVLRMETSGAVTVRRNAIFLETSPPILQVNRWYYMEIKGLVSTTAGFVVVKLDGTTVWSSATNLNTQDNTTVFWDSIKFNAGIGVNQTMDDLYICDTAGSVNNDFLGDTSVEHINPNAVGDDSVWTPSSAGDHYILIDDGTARTTSVDETDYVESGTTGQKDLFNYGSLATGPGLGDATTIHGIQINTWARITEIQPSDLLMKTKTGVTESDVTKTIRHDDVNQFMEFAVFELDADTAAAWTVSGINGAQFGIETGSI